jgi:ferredoxin
MNILEAFRKLKDPCDECIVKASCLGSSPDYFISSERMKSICKDRIAYLADKIRKDSYKQLLIYRLTNIFVTLSIMCYGIVFAICVFGLYTFKEGTLYYILGIIPLPYILISLFRFKSKKEKPLK